MRHWLGYMVYGGIALFTIGAMPSYSQQPDLAMRTTETCLGIPSERNELVDWLEMQGWKYVVNSELPPTAIYGNAALQLSRNLGFDNEPKVRWMAGWALALKNAEALRNVKMLPDEIGARLFFISKNGSFLEAKFKKKFWLTQVVCDAALVSADMAQVLTGIEASLGRELSRLPPIARLNPQQSEDEDASRSYNLVLANANEVANLIDEPFKFAGFVLTLVRTNPPLR